MKKFFSLPISKLSRSAFYVALFLPLIIIGSCNLDDFLSDIFTENCEIRISSDRVQTNTLRGSCSANNPYVLTLTTSEGDTYTINSTNKSYINIKPKQEITITDGAIKITDSTWTFINGKETYAIVTDSSYVYGNCEISFFDENERKTNSQHGFCDDSVDSELTLRIYASKDDAIYTNATHTINRGKHTYTSIIESKTTEKTGYVDILGRWWRFRWREETTGSDQYSPKYVEIYK